MIEVASRTWLYILKVSIVVLTTASEVLYELTTLKYGNEAQFLDQDA